MLPFLGGKVLLPLPCGHIFREGGNVLPGGAIGFQFLVQMLCSRVERINGRIDPVHHFADIGISLLYLLFFHGHKGTKNSPNTDARQNPY